MSKEWTREGTYVSHPDVGSFALDSGWKYVPVAGTKQSIDRLIADANKWAANEAAFAAMKAAIKAHRDEYGSLDVFLSVKTEHRALLAALALAEPEPEPESLTITMPPDTAGEIIALLTKVARLLEKKGANQ